MEDIYDDLKNYEDVNALEELRAENKELKVKLEEHSAAMEKLQKDYDILETEFKQLENNYSSLLMTARAELKRKTVMITQLNAHKDLMILDAFKSGQNIRRHFNKGVNNPGRMKQDYPLKGNKKTKEDNVKPKSVDLNPERREPLVKPTTEAGLDSGTSNTNKSSKAAGVQLELSNNRKSNVNDNIVQQKTEINECPQTSASSIKDRRKSLSTVSMPIDTFSSCDELERNYPTKETRTDNERRYINKWPIERSSNKTSETFNVDDRGHKHRESSSGDIYKSRSSKQYNSSSYRNRDKYEVSLKYRKQYSPERGQKRHHREHPDDYTKKYREYPDNYPRQHRDHPDDYPKQHRDHPDDYPKHHRDHPDDHPKQNRDHPDDYPKQHRDCPDDYTKKHRDHPDDYPKQNRDHPDDYPKQNRDHPDDYPKQHRDRPDDYTKKHRDHPDDYLKQNRDHPDDYPKKNRDHPDDYPKQHRDRPDDYTKKHRDHPDDYPKQNRDHPDDYPKLHRDRPDDYTKKHRELPDDNPKQHREHPDDFHKHERGRYQERSLESPPPQSYDRHQRMKSVHQSDHDRYHPEPEKNRYGCDDKYSAKYRSKDDDEPQIKRQRTESYGNPETLSMDDKRHYRARDSVDTPKFSPHHEMLSFTCQSPDSVHIEGAIAHHAKEIKATASTPLDDPRVTSKRYVFRKENGKESYAAVGSNIDLIPVTKGVWNIKPVDVPAALMHRPSQCSDQLEKDIHMDIENLVTNLDASMESGEVRTDDEFSEIRSKLKEIKHNTQDFKISKQAPEDISKQPVNETVSKSNIAKYKIPKVWQMNKNTQSKMDVPIIELGEMVPQNKNVNKNGAAEELLTQKQQNNKLEDFRHNDKNNSKVEGRKKSKSRERGEHQSTLTKMAIVADDLELSDDNSDHMDTKKTVSEKVPKICRLPLSDGRSNKSVNNEEEKTVVSTPNKDIKSTVDTTGIKNVAEEEKSKETNNAKKHKAKKKKSKSKQISKDSPECTADPVHVPVKKPKPKNEKKTTPKETKEKFCDLFGDSNSLMTPEDLGIPSYLPISEDAQDAVDMKINQIIDAAPLVDKDEIPGEMLPQKRAEVTKQETAHDNFPKADLQKSNTAVEDNEVVYEFKKKASSKRNEEIIDSNQLPSPIVYENLNPGTDLNDPNVVKTVIISTGKQPEIAYENKIEVTKPDTVVKINSIQNTKDINLFPATMEFKKDILKALATSTPHKEFSALNPLEADAAKTDIICDPCISKAVATITNVEPVVNQTEKTSLESNDAPDVRIFLKRRRKVVKRPQMT